MKGRLFHWTDPVEAINNVHQALSVYRGPELPSLLATLGRYYAGVGFPEIARKNAEDQLRVNNDSATYYRALGFIGYMTGNFEDAVKNYKKVYISDSTDLEILFHLGHHSSMVV